MLRAEDIFGEYPRPKTPQTFQELEEIAHGWPGGVAAPESDAADVSVLAQVEEFIRLYLFAPEAAYLPLAVFFVATHVADVFYCFPYVGITSPTKGCGKTRVLELGNLFCVKAVQITAASVASVFRMLGNCSTLLWDECESFRNKHRSESTELIIQILNVGYKKGATVPRADGPNHAVTQYPVYGPKLFTAIRDLPETLADRSIRVHLQKRPKDKKLNRWKEKWVNNQAAPIRQVIEEWARVNRENVGLADDQMEDLEFLGDREAEIWSPLFVVCSVLAPERVQELKKCSLTLTKKKAGNNIENELSLKLLADLRGLESKVTEAGERDNKGQYVVSGAFLVESLKVLAENPWSDPKHELTERRLARMLYPFDVEPRQTRIGNRAGLSRYSWRELEAVFSVYLPIQDQKSSTSSTTPIGMEDSADFESSTDE